jgi:hypothetical protein
LFKVQQSVERSGAADWTEIEAVDCNASGIHFLRSADTARLAMSGSEREEVPGRKTGQSDLP